MKKNIIQVDNQLALSRYRQIINSLTTSIREGQLCVGDQLPSINQVCQQWGLSRDTVMNAYNELKARGIISSMPGKGYYVISDRIELRQKILLLFDELNGFKEDLYNAFLENLPDYAEADIYFHHFNRKVFENLLQTHQASYTTFVIMPAQFQQITELLSGLNGKVIILDQLPEELKGAYPAIYQNFEKDTYEALKSGHRLITRYEKLIMVHPGGKEPAGQYQGFLKYCLENQVPYELIGSLGQRTIRKGEAYIAISDRDLVWLIKEARAMGMVPGSDLGLISYNDTALKEVVAEGITTISTDFSAMGKTLAGLIGEKGQPSLENPARLIVRKSL